MNPLNLVNAKAKQLLVELQQQQPVGFTGLALLTITVEESGDVDRRHHIVTNPDHAFHGIVVPRNFGNMIDLADFPHLGDVHAKAVWPHFKHEDFHLVGARLKQNSGIDC